MTFYSHFGVRASARYWAFVVAPAALLAIVSSIGAAADAARELGRVKVKPLDEVSGIAASRQNPAVVWMHNDGDVGQIYAVQHSGKVAAQLRTPRGIEDLEDIAIGPGPEDDRDYLYLGDIGDNDGDRRAVQVMRFPEPKLGGSGQEVAQQIEVIRLSYPDGPHDAEALLVDPKSGDMFLVTKEESRSRIYHASSADAAGSGPIQLRQIAELSVAQVSAGDISRDGRWVALRSEEVGWLWERRNEESLAAALAREPEIIPVLGRKQGPNGEALAFASDGAAYFTMSEGNNERLYSFPKPSDVQ